MVFARITPTEDAHDGDIGAALLSFETESPIPIMGWIIDYNSMTLIPVDDPNTIEVGDCYLPEARQ